MQFVIKYRPTERRDRSTENETEEYGFRFELESTVSVRDRRKGTATDK